MTQSAKGAALFESSIAELPEKLLQGHELAAQRVASSRGAQGFDLGSELPLSLEKSRLVGIDRFWLQAQRI
jgi:hypothetical protein